MFCELYSHERIQYNSEIIKNDITIIISLIDTFFYKKHLYFSSAELSVLTVLIHHYFTCFLSVGVLEKSFDEQIFVISHLCKLISIEPKQSESVFLMF